MAFPRSVGVAAAPRTLRLHLGALARTVVVAVLALDALGYGLASAVVADRLTRPYREALSGTPAEYETRVIRFFGETLSATPGGR